MYRETSTPLTIQEQHRQSLRSAGINLTKAILGVGVLALPKVTALLGLGTTLIFLFFIAVLTYFSLHYCTVASSRTGYVRYSDVVREHTGIVGQTFLDISLIVNSGGVLVIALMIVGDILVGSGRDQGLLSPECGSRSTVLAVVTIFLLAPLSSVTRLRSVAATSLLGVVAIVSWAVVTVLLFISAWSNKALHVIHWWPKGRFVGHGFESAVQTVATLPVILFAFICQMSLQHVLRDLQYVRDRQVDRVTGSSLAICTIAYAAIGVCSYALFGRHVDADVLLEFTVDALSPMVPEPLAHACFLAIRLGFVVSLLGIFPIHITPLRDAVWKLLFRQELQGPGLWLVSYMLLAGVYFIATWLPSIWEPLLLIGSTAGVGIALIFPGLLAIRTPEILTEPESARLGRIIGGSFLLVVGIVSGISGILRVILYRDPLEG